MAQCCTAFHLPHGPLRNDGNELQIGLSENSHNSTLMKPYLRQVGPLVAENRIAAQTLHLIDCMWFIFWPRL